MSASPQPHWAEEYMESAAKAMGLYLPEESCPQAFDTVIQFGKIALAVREDLENDAYGNPELAQTLSRLGDTALGVGVVLLRMIPPSEFRKLEREHLKLVKSEDRAEQTEPFWQETIERPPTRHGMLSDWLAAAFIHFQNRPLSYDDLAKVVHAEDYDSVTRGQNNARIKAKVMSDTGKRSLAERLAPKGLSIRSFYLQYPSGTRRNVRLICVPVETTIGRYGLDEATKPTDDELRALAISLRQEEWDSGQTSRIQKEIQEWEQEQANGSEVDDNPWGLTKTELAVLKHLPSGKSNKEIAKSLSLSPGAVNSGVHSLFRKLSKFNIKDRVSISTLAYNEFMDEVSQHVSFVLEDINKLNPAEIRALEALSQGLPRFEIVQLNGVSESTLAGHIHGVYRKLRINRMQTGIFVQEARKAGLFDVYEEQLKNRRAGTSKRSIRSSDDQEMDFDMGRIIDRGDRDLFRKRAYTAFFKVSKVLSERDKPVKNLVLRIDNTQLLEDLVRRGIITRQQYERGEIDRATAVARTLIRADQDLGLLSTDQVDEAMEIIREEEVRYFQRFDEVDKRRKA